MLVMRTMAAVLLLAAATWSGAAGAEGPVPLAPGQHLTARFEHERRIAGFDAPLVAAGEMTLSAGGELIWRTTSPVASELVMTPEVIVQFVDGQVALRVPLGGSGAQGQLNELLLHVLAGNWKGLGIAPQRDGNGWRITVSGSALPAPLARQLATLEAHGGDFVEAVKLTRPTGDRDDFRFRDQARHDGSLAERDRTLLRRARAE